MDYLIQSLPSGSQALMKLIGQQFNHQDGIGYGFINNAIAEYKITSSEEGQKIRAILSYQDDQGFEESVTSHTSSIPFVDDGEAVFAISGTTQVGQTLSITESTADSDGTGTLSYV